MEFLASGEVRTAIIMDEWENGSIPSQRPYLYFGDIIGNAYAIDAQNGELIWKIKANNHPNSTLTAAPAIFEDKLYSYFRFGSCCCF